MTVRCGARFCCLTTPPSRAPAPQPCPRPRHVIPTLAVTLNALVNRPGRYLAPVCMPVPAPCMRPPPSPTQNQESAHWLRRRSPGASRGPSATPPIPIPIPIPIPMTIPKVNTMMVRMSISRGPGTRHTSRCTSSGSATPPQSLPRPTHIGMMNREMAGKTPRLLVNGCLPWNSAWRVEDCQSMTSLQIGLLETRTHLELGPHATSPGQCTSSSSGAGVWPPLLRRGTQGLWASRALSRASPATP
jgi:hypothetical protein